LEGWKTGNVLTALKAGLCYFAVVFSIGFALGALRELVVRPVLGNDLARLAELPVMVVLAWLICRWLVLRMQVPADVFSRVAMGAVMFALAMIAEVMVGQFVMKLALPDQMRMLTSATGMAGLLAQLATAAFPYLQAKREQYS
jgi:hypothetical protein